MNGFKTSSILEFIAISFWNDMTPKNSVSKIDWQLFIGISKSSWRENLIPINDSKLKNWTFDVFIPCNKKGKEEKQHFYYVKWNASFILGSCWLKKFEYCKLSKTFEVLHWEEPSVGVLCVWFSQYTFPDKDGGLLKHNY